MARPRKPEGEKLQAITVYLPVSEIEDLEREGREEGREGASPQIRYVLTQRRKESRGRS
jgi:hypothetical protein